MYHPFSLQHIKKNQSEICIYNETIMMLTIHKKKTNIYIITEGNICNRILILRLHH